MKVFKIIIKVIVFILAICISFLAFYTVVGYSMYKEALEQVPISEKIEQLKSKDNYVLLDDVPKIYKDAVIAVEDHRFYYHSGVDYFSICRAIFNNITSQSLSEGGSTITQQLCKNVYFTQERKLERKFAEIFMSFEFEKECSKDEILELYINTCFYGNGCYTLKEASNLYYKKEPNKLTDYEATMIAGIPNAPSLYNPIHSLKLAKERQRQVLYAMVLYDVITKEERDEILSHEAEEDSYFITE
jgi:membrane peptidoglycan carboxypeptidase